MGLDITFCRRANRLRDLAEDGECDWQAGEFNVHVNAPAFAARADGLGPGVYRADEVGSFRAGSYSGYGLWRDQLAKLADYKAVEDPDGPHSHAAAAWRAVGGPFWPLINFTDCEGVIGPACAALLHDDFAAFASRAADHADPHFRDLFLRFARAFATASDGGLVLFH